MDRWCKNAVRDDAEKVEKESALQVPDRALRGIEDLLGVTHVREVQVYVDIDNESDVRKRVQRRDVPSRSIEKIERKLERDENPVDDQDNLLECHPARRGLVSMVSH